MSVERPNRIAARYIVREFGPDWETISVTPGAITAHSLMLAIELWNMKHQQIAREGALFNDARKPGVLLEVEVVYVEV